VRRPAAAALLTVLATAAAGCGDDGDAAAEEPLVVAAAASLAEPLRACSRTFAGARVRLALAGSDELAAQIRRGVRPDVFAAADATLAAELAREGLVGRPRAFATNELVVAVRRGSSIGTLRDLGADGVRIAIGTPTVPVGAYARAVLDRLGPGLRARIRANVRSEEPAVTGIVGKLTQGAVDAGFVYATDAAAADGLQVVRLPARLRPTVTYAAAVVRDAPRPAPARRYLDGLVRGPCRRALDAAGFGAAP
jgi:molybdate transport system substrate-binding protein